jgi:hypothetical protein
LITPPLILYGVKTMVFLPNAIAANQAATEAMHQMVEGGFSTVQLAPVRGLRFAIRRSTTESALWQAKDSCVGFLNADGQNVLVWWDNNVNLIKRRIGATPSCTAISGCNVAGGQEEILPYDVTPNISIRQDGTTAVFRYYNQSGSQIPTPVCSPTTIRRVDIAFVAQTGNGVFDEGQAQERIASSVAIRVP